MSELHASLRRGCGEISNQKPLQLGHSHLGKSYFNPMFAVKSASGCVPAFVFVERLLAVWAFGVSGAAHPACYASALTPHLAFSYSRLCVLTVLRRPDMDPDAVIVLRRPRDLWGSGGHSSG